jgi:hypothetical protein
MRRGYNQDIRAEAITQRYQRKEWKDIQDSIVKKFDLKPSIRQMQKWFEDYKGTTDDPTGTKFIAKVIEDAANMAKPLAQAKMMVEVMPLWANLQKEQNLSVVDAGWTAFLSFFESQIGRENFDRIVKQYLKMRDKLSPSPGKQI